MIGVSIMSCVFLHSSIVAEMIKSLITLVNASSRFINNLCLHIFLKIHALIFYTIFCQ